MAVLLNPGYGYDGREWLEAFRRELPGADFHLWPDAPHPDEVEFVVAVRHDPAELHRYPHLRAVLAMGAGVEQYTGPEMPDVPVVRLVEPTMHDEMAAYVTHWVVHFQKRMDVYLDNQADHLWRTEDYPTADRYPIGILGYGLIGRRIGEALHGLGYPINTWSRRGRGDEWATVYSGAEGLAECLSASAAVVNVLPDTPSTRHLMNAASFTSCRPGALFINLGRGATVDERALLDALESGHVGHAVLDVTDPEPMPPGNPLWAHPRVRITPHIAGYTVVGPAVKVIAKNIDRIQRGEDPFPVVDRAAGY